MIKQISHKEKTVAIIIPGVHQGEGVEFVTPNHFSQQLSYMHHPAGKTITPHTHNLVMREVQYTLEVLFIRRGKLRVDFYTDDQEYIESCIIEAGDTILLASGGHGFEVIEEIEMIEVKQGPYAGENDKTRFEPKVKTSRLSPKTKIGNAKIHSNTES